MKKKLLSMCLGLLFCGSAMAQMEILYNGASLTTTTLTDGTTLVQFPEDVVFNTTDFQNKISVTVDDSSVANDAIVPNPATTFITENEIETFVYGGKAYSFRFTAGEYFTVVMFSDPHVTSEDTQTEISTKMEGIVNFGKNGGISYTFSSLPGYTPTADLVVCLGDMDANDCDDEYFSETMSVFAENGIPFITLGGNHDLEPDFYNDNSYGNTSNGQSQNEQTFTTIKNHYTAAQSATNGGITNLESITDPNLGSSITQNEHFTFKFKGVRFYCANNYWWQKPYSGTAINALGNYYQNTAKTYSAKGTLDALNNFVEGHKDEPSVWLSHFPFYSEANSGEDNNIRWWLDQNYPSDSSTPKALIPEDGEAEFYSEDAFTTDAGKTIAANKKKYLADIIVKTKNPRHFSGHAHKNDGANVTATNGTTFRDHTIKPISNEGSENGMPGNTFVVLCKAGVGIIQVERVNF